MGEHNIMILASIGMTAMACQWLAWKLRLPAILFLLLAGLLAGPVTGWLDPDALFGELLFPFVSLSVAVILFEGSMTLQFREIRGLEKVVRRLVSTGMFITWGVTTAAAHWIMGFSWHIALLFGAITVVTGPTVIAPLLRTVRPVARVANTLRWEGIIIDPIGALLAVLAYELTSALNNNDAWSHALFVFGQTVVTGVLAGIVAGFITSEIVRRNWLADYLVNVTVLALVFGAFALSNELRHESGLLCVTIMGMWMGNRQGVPTEDILEFKETLSLLLLSVLFIVLAARMDFESLRSLGWKAFAVLAIMLLIARPLKVAFSARGSALTWRERVLLAWIAPRGIVAAAVSALFALKLEALGIPGADQLLPLTFLVIIGTVILQSATARPIALALGLVEPEPVGFLIVGANPVARLIGASLHKANVPVRLCDSDWDNIAKARMEGLPTYYGSPISEHAKRNLDLTGIGRVLALGAGVHFNELVAARYRDEFGKNSAYNLPNTGDAADTTSKHQISTPHHGRTLFSKSMNYWQLASLQQQGAAIHTATLSNSFSFEQYLESHGNGVIPLFAINPKGYAEPFTVEHPPVPEAGWSILSLFEPATEKKHLGNGEEYSAPHADHSENPPGASPLPLNGT